MFPKQTLFGEERQNQLAQFVCLNATGKRLTSKSTTLEAKPFVVPYRQSVKNAEGKMVTTTTNTEAGHLLRNDETVTSNFIVIVPEGERRRIQVRVREAAEAFLNFSANCPPPTANFNLLLPSQTEGWRSGLSRRS